tara:strand:+ start:486 stop:728 length:243 start_codon:yes stop_codon:yes gene_type:complete
MSTLKVDTIAEKSAASGITFSNDVNGLSLGAGAQFANNGQILADTTTTTAANVSSGVIGPIDVTAGYTWTIADGSSITVL